MKASENEKLQEMLKEFKKGHRVPAGYTAVYSNGISKQDIYGNEGKNCGKKIDVARVYDCPSYDILKDGETLFMIEAYAGKIIVMGESNSEPVNSWEQAFEVGLDYYKNGY